VGSFTTGPVKAGLPTLLELHEASPELQRIQGFALVAIADQLDEAAEQLSGWRSSSEGVDINMTQRGMRHRPAPQPLRRELAHVLLCGPGLVGAEGLVLPGPRA
jgi:hypothetical protein